MANNYDSNSPIEHVDVPDNWGTFDTTTIQQFEAQVKLEDQKRELELIDEYIAKNPPESDEGAADAEPSVLSFFSGRPYDEGLAAYNKHRLANGQAPILKGGR